MTDCDVITHSIVKQTWHVTTKEAAGKYTTPRLLHFNCTFITAD